jgi:hypothetical protein
MASILLPDDVPAVRISMRIVPRGGGYEVTSISGGNDWFREGRVFAYAPQTNVRFDVDSRGDEDLVVMRSSLERLLIPEQAS